MDVITYPCWDQSYALGHINLGLFLYLWYHPIIDWYCHIVHVTCAVFCLLWPLWQKISTSHMAWFISPPNPRFFDKAHRHFTFWRHYSPRSLCHCLCLIFYTFVTTITQFSSGIVVISPVIKPIHRDSKLHIPKQPTCLGDCNKIHAVFRYAPS